MLPLCSSFHCPGVMRLRTGMNDVTVIAARNEQRLPGHSGGEGQQLMSERIRQEAAVTKLRLSPQCAIETIRIRAAARSEGHRIYRSAGMNPPDTIGPVRSH